MLANYGSGWMEEGDFPTLLECKLKAALYAKEFSIQTGCGSVRDLERWKVQAAFQQAAATCAAQSGVRITHKPGTRVTIFGSPRARFDFNDCMAKSGQPTD